VTIQELHEIVKQKDAEIAALNARVAALEEIVADITRQHEGVAVGRAHPTQAVAGMTQQNEQMGGGR
jgi:hypothetical protein